ncbi:hypothetical protein AALP_AA5G089400 [Arabis alpina]|uniref:non-specific serine/threonine protein kinase n=1 Tax=Arabis alpina TaxID=50452 RepID=A0A087GVV3_ARAAL|nr:hypothetical protein AALP_AA5G089400 [Arabis alpina]
MAFLVSPTIDLRSGAAASYLGVFNKTNDNRTDNHILAVEIDTHDNPEALDSSDNHVGIDINSIVSIQYENASYFDDTVKMNSSMLLASKQRIHIWIEYDGEQRLLNVTLAPIGTRKPSLPLLSRFIDLSKVFKEQMYLGFSGSTSAITSHQYILGWALAIGGKAQSLDISKVLDLPQPPPYQTPPSSPALSHLQVILISTISPVTLVMILGGILYPYFKKQYAEVFEQWEQEYSPQRFFFKTLFKATKGFKENRVIGVGGFGKVYRGDLRDGTQIAVKRVSHGSEQGIREYVSEIATMGRLGHRNVVQLLGYCRRKGELLLVYEFMPNGSVSGYLLQGWRQVVLHRDIKGGNVLLDADLNGKLGDFGLARFHDRGMALEVRHVEGTAGFMAPELSSEGLATTNTDVYAFGAFLLEVICGKKPFDPHRPREQVMLIEWVANCQRMGCITDTIDSRLVGNFRDEEAKMMLKIGLICSQNNPEDRPSMRKILEYLEGNATAPELGNDVETTVTTTSSSADYTLDTVTVLFEGR